MVELTEDQGLKKVSRITGLAITGKNVINLANYNNGKYMRLASSVNLKKDRLPASDVHPTT